MGKYIFLMYVVVEKGSQLRTSHIYYLVFPLEVRKKEKKKKKRNSGVAFANLFLSQMSVTKGQSLLGSATRSQESRLEHSFKLFLLILEEVRGQKNHEKHFIYIYIYISFHLFLFLILVRIEPDLSHTKHEKKKNSNKIFWWKQIE